MVSGQTGLEDAVRVAEAAVGDDAGAAARLQPPHIKIARRRGARVAARINDENMARRTGLHRLALDLPARSARGGPILVLARRDEAHGERDTDHARNVVADR